MPPSLLRRRYQSPSQHDNASVSSPASSSSSPSTSASAASSSVVATATGLNEWEKTPQQRGRCAGGGKGGSIDWRAVMGEFLATATFVWAGCGAAVSSNRWGVGSNGGYGSADLVAIALGFGLSITTLAFAFGHVSGGHMNPAVTLAFVCMKTMTPLSGVLYVAAQFMGAFFGALVLWGCTSSLTRYCDDPEADPEYADDISQAICDASRSTDGSYGPPFGLGANQVAPRVTEGCAFLIEGVGTFVLVLVVLHAGLHPKSESGNSTAIAIGWAVLIVHLVLVPFTGCGINPARAFGPLMVDSLGGLDRWTRGWWVFFTAPWVGSLFATWTYQFVFMPPQQEQALAPIAEEKRDALPPTTPGGRGAGGDVECGRILVVAPTEEEEGDDADGFHEEGDNNDDDDDMGTATAKTERVWKRRIDTDDEFVDDRPPVRCEV